MKKKIVISFLIYALVSIHSVLHAQIITTIAGGGSGGDGSPAISAAIADCADIFFDYQGNLYLTEGFSAKIRKIDAVTGIITTVAGTGVAAYHGDGGLADTSTLTGANCGYADPSGNFYVGGGFRIRKINAITNIISTYVGDGINGYTGDGGIADTTEIENEAFAIDGIGNMYIGDVGRVRKIDTSGIITTIAGNGTSGDSGDGGPAISATVEGAYDMYTDAHGNVYITSNETIRKINVSTGIISKVAGTVDHAGPYLGDGIPATSAYIRPFEVAVDDTGNLYIADEFNARIEKVDTFGIIHTVTGNGTNGFSGDSHNADSAEVSYPEGVAIDPCGNLYIADFGNNRIREITLRPLAATPTPTINISATSDTVCTGTSVTFNSAVVGSSTRFAYQWYVNGLPLSAATSTSYSYTPTNGDAVRCVFYKRNTCSTPVNDSSNIIHMVVNTAAIPTINISPAADTVCAGTAVTFTTATTSAGGILSYQWKLNGSNVGSSASSYTYTPSNGDSVRCVLTSTPNCSSSTTTSSNTVHMVVNPLVTPSINISASTSDTVCAGTSVTYTSSISNGGSSPAYHWYVNGVVMPGGSSSSYTYSPNNGDSIRCVLNSSVLCPTSSSVSSITIHMVVDPIYTPTVTIVPETSDTVCLGWSEKYIATVAGGGTDTAYKWYVNAVLVSTTSSNEYLYYPSIGDSIYCVVDVGSACSSNGLSNVIHIIVITPPAITITGNPTAAVGSTVTVNATVAGAGSSYLIDWYNNGTLFSTTTIPKITYTKVTGTDHITAKIISSLAGCDDTATSLVLIITSATTGVSNIAVPQTNIYPNPTNAILHIDNVSTLTSYKMLNIIGSVLQQGILQPGNNDISIQAISPGIYLLELTDNQGQKTVSKIVKQ